MNFPGPKPSACSLLISPLIPGHLALLLKSAPFPVFPNSPYQQSVSPHVPWNGDHPSGAIGASIFELIITVLECCLHGRPRKETIGLGELKYSGEAMIWESKITIPVGSSAWALPWARLPDLQRAILENGGGVSEHEIDGSGDGAVAVELSVRVHVERVLVPVDSAVIYNRLIALDPESHGLMFLRPGGILNPNILRHKPIPLRYNRRRFTSLKPSYVTPITRNLRLCRAVPDKNHVQHFLRENNVFLINAGLDVDNERLCPFERDSRDGLVDCLVFPRPVFSDHGEAALGGGNPSRKIVPRVLEESPAKTWNVERGYSFMDFINHFQGIAELEIGGGGGVVQHLIQGPPDIINGVLQQALADLKRLRGPGVLGGVLESLGPLHNVRDLIHRNIKRHFHQLLRVGAVGGGG
nr:unknown [Ipomoea trifida]